MQPVVAAEGSSDPYWSDAADREARMQRIMTILQRQPDRDRIAFFVGKSNNDNFVCYLWNGDIGNMEPYWISTENVPAERRDPLNVAEEMLYGTEMEVTASGEWLLNVRAEPIKARKFNLTLDDNDRPTLLGGVNNEMCVLESAYVQMKRGLLPDVDHVVLTGRSLKDGKTRQEILSSDQLR
jgi:hypothetical protein